MNTEIRETEHGFVINRACRFCGCCDMTITTGKGPHGHGLICGGCDRHNGWLSKAHAAILDDAKNKGFIDYEAVARRRKQSENAAIECARTGDQKAYFAHMNLVEKYDQILSEKQ